uniref:Hydrophobic protein n=1 Tax=Streptomyces sp. NBC_00003 TaxID=2903608 RepID=A0AAU2V051_9ACTN
MIVLLVLLVMALFGLGFVNALWWVLGAVVLFGLFRYGRGGYGGWDRGGDAGFRNYRDYRDREDRWGRRYDHQRRGRWLRQDRRDREHHG